MREGSAPPFGAALVDGVPGVLLLVYKQIDADTPELTARVVHAMQHPAARCLSHPTGRILGHRPENAIDLDRVIEVAIETGVALEVNGLPDRLDLAPRHVRSAIAAGARIVCSSDAHSVAGLANMTYAVHTARRGGATAAAVVNTRPVDEVATRGSRGDPTFRQGDGRGTEGEP